MEKLLEIDTKLIAATFDKGASYTNLVIAAGYATFFGLWTMTKGYLPKTPAKLAAIFILASAACFVFFEVYKMWRLAGALDARRARLVERIRGKPLPEVLAEYQRVDGEEEEELLPLIPTWRVCLLFTVITGLLGVAILLGTLIYALFAGAA